MIYAGFIYVCPAVCKKEIKKYLKIPNEFDKILIQKHYINQSCS